MKSLQPHKKNFTTDFESFLSTLNTKQKQKMCKVHQDGWLCIVGHKTDQVETKQKLT